MVTKNLSPPTVTSKPRYSGPPLQQFLAVERHSCSLLLFAFSMEEGVTLLTTISLPFLAMATLTPRMSLTVRLLSSATAVLIDGTVALDARSVSFTFDKLKCVRSGVTRKVPSTLKRAPSESAAGIHADVLAVAQLHFDAAELATRGIGDVSQAAVAADASEGDIRERDLEPRFRAAEWRRVATVPVNGG